MPGKQTVAGGVAASDNHAVSRRDFLRLGGVGLAGMAMFGAWGCGDAGGGGEGSGKLVFSALPDQSGGGFRSLIDKFNEQNKGKFRVAYKQMSPESNEHFDQLKTELQAGGSEIDVIGGTVVWTAELAENGWILDVSGRLSEGERGRFLLSPIHSLTYEDKIYGVPWFTDAGLLFYRKDLLEQSGFSEPPKTWEELKEMALKVVRDSGIRYGFVFQGAIDETGVCNGLEYIWTHGGEVLDGEKVIIDSRESVAGLTTEQSLVADQVAPQAVARFTATDSGLTYLNGDAVFCRNWPFMYEFVGNPDISKIELEQVGVSQLPVGDELRQSAGCLGGWNMLINASSEMQDEAWEFVKFMTSEENQKAQTLSSSTLPTLKTLYDDRDIREEVPVVALSKEALQTARPRPVSPYYSQMSREMAKHFNKALTGATSPKEVIETLQSELQQIIEERK